MGRVFLQNKSGACDDDSSRKALDTEELSDDCISDLVFQLLISRLLDQDFALFNVYSLFVYLTYLPTK